MKGVAVWLLALLALASAAPVKKEKQLPYVQSARQVGRRLPPAHAATPWSRPQP
jgi:hypothetical protein